MTAHFTLRECSLVSQKGPFQYEYFINDAEVQSSVGVQLWVTGVASKTVLYLNKILNKVIKSV